MRLPPRVSAEVHRHLLKCTDLVGGVETPTSGQRRGALAPAEPLYLIIKLRLPPRVSAEVHDGYAIICSECGPVLRLPPRVSAEVHPRRTGRPTPAGRG